MEDVVSSNKKLPHLGQNFNSVLNSVKKLTFLALHVEWYLMLPASGWRLNDTLVKGRNNMNMLVVIAICWIIYGNAFHTYIQNTYSSA